MCELTALPRLGCEVMVTHPPLPAPSAPLLVLSSGLQPLLHRFCPRVLLRARPAAAALPPEPLVAAGAVCCQRCSSAFCWNRLRYFGMCILAN